MNETGAGK